MSFLLWYNIHSCNVYCFLDLGFTFSYVTHYVVIFFGFDPKVILDYFSISNPLSYLVISKKVYRGMWYLFVASRPWWLYLILLWWI